MTAPLGWLKRNKSIFVPRLTTELSGAIDHMSYGGLEKVWINFPKAFWDPPADQGTAEKRLHSEETSFLAPEYASQTNPYGWNLEMVSLPVLSELSLASSKTIFKIPQPSMRRLSFSSNSITLVFQVTRPHHLTANQKPFSQHNGRMTSGLATARTQITRSGLSMETNDIEIMRAGMGADRGIWFPGEHTAPFLSFGTVTGAYLTGESVADNIIELYGMDHPKPRGEKLES